MGANVFSFFEYHLYTLQWVIVTVCGSQFYLCDELLWLCVVLSCTYVMSYCDCVWFSVLHLWWVIVTVCGSSSTSVMSYCDCVWFSVVPLWWIIVTVCGSQLYFCDELLWLCVVLSCLQTSWNKTVFLIPSYYVSILIKVSTDVYTFCPRLASCIEQIHSTKLKNIYNFTVVSKTSPSHVPRLTKKKTWVEFFYFFVLQKLKYECKTYRSSIFPLTWRLFQCLPHKPQKLL